MRSRKSSCKPPPGGIPGVPEDAAIELLKPVKGLADAPRAWYQSFTKALDGMGCKAAQLDQCVYLSGVPQGILALHVDDMLCGGAEWFHEHVLKKPRGRFHLKHFKRREGDFLAGTSGRRVQHTCQSERVLGELGVREDFS